MAKSAHGPAALARRFMTSSIGVGNFQRRAENAVPTTMLIRKGFTTARAMASRIALRQPADWLLSSCESATATDATIVISPTVASIAGEAADAPSSATRSGIARYPMLVALAARP